jgi:hypothetical protein
MEKTYFVVAVGEVQTADVHAGIEHFNEHVDIPAGRAKCADDFGFS